MRSRIVGLAGGMLAATVLAGPAATPARADSLSSPVFQVTDLGVAEIKGINNAGKIFGNAGGTAFTSQAPQPVPDAPGDSQGGAPPAPPLSTVGGLGDGYNIAYGVNAAGQVVGQLQTKTDAGTYLQPYVQSGGTTTQIPTLGGSYGGALGINSFGQVVGSSQTSGGQEHAFSYNPGNGQVSDLGTLGGKNSDARGINDAGQVIGSAQNASGDWNAYIKNSGGSMQSLGTLGGSNSWAFAINPSGQVVGGSETADGHTMAFLYKDGQMQNLGSLGTGSFASGIDSYGRVVGWNTGVNNDYHAFVYTNGQMYDLNNYLPSDSPFSVLNGAVGINDAGQVVGWGKLTDGSQHAFLLTLGGPFSPAPIPEPTALAVFGVIAALGAARQYRRAVARARG
jgi:probable HAF family extracellular repeat protein